MKQESMGKGIGSIGRLAQAAELPAKTIRYYEEVKLLPRPERTPSGYRQYSSDTVERLRFIKRTQHLGMKLDEIRAILELMDRGRCPCGHVERLLKQELEEIRVREEALAALKRRIQKVLKGVVSSPAQRSKGQAKCSTMDRVTTKTVHGGKGDVRKIRGGDIHVSHLRSSLPLK